MLLEAVVAVEAAVADASVPRTPCKLGARCPCPRASMCMQSSSILEAMLLEAVAAVAAEVAAAAAVDYPSP